MSKNIKFMFVIVAILLVSPGIVMADEISDGVKKAIAASEKSIVTVEVTRKVVLVGWGGSKNEMSVSVAFPGIIISKDGYLITSSGLNNYPNSIEVTIEKITVVIGKDKKYEAKLVGENNVKGMSLLKIDAKDPFVPQVFDDKATMAHGDVAIMVYRAGTGRDYAISAENSRVLSIFSVPNINEPVYDLGVSRVNESPKYSLVFNSSGKAIGILSLTVVTPLDGQPGVARNIAIPSKWFVDLLSDPVKKFAPVDQDKKEGEMPEKGDVAKNGSWTGLTLQALTPDLAEELGIKGTDGVIVVKVDAMSPALNSGLKPGDIITNFDGKDVVAKDDKEKGTFLASITEIPVGKKINLTVIRSKVKQPFVLVTAKQPAPPQEKQRYENPVFGFMVRGVTMADVENLELKEIYGAVVISIEGGSWAQLGRIRVGDFIEKINDVKIKDVEHLKSVIEDLIKKKEKKIMIYVNRNRRDIFVSIEPSWNDDNGDE